MPLNSTPPSKNIEDGLLASGLITAPAWGPWLSQLNIILTTVSLAIGVTIGLYRLWRIFQNTQQKNNKAKRKDPTKDE